MIITSLNMTDKRIDITYTNKLNVSKNGDIEEVLYSSPELPNADLLTAVDSLANELLKDIELKVLKHNYGLKKLNVIYSDNSAVLANIKAKVIISKGQYAGEISFEPTYACDIDKPCSPIEKLLKSVLNACEGYVSGQRAQGTLPLEGAEENEQER